MEARLDKTRVMPTFRQKAISLVDEVMQHYIFSMKVNDYRAFQQDLVSGIEQKILGKDRANGPIPLPEAREIFDKMMYLAALYDAKERTDGAISMAAEFLGYSREHFSREIKNHGIKTDPFKLNGQKTRADFGYFQQRLLEEILREQTSRYKAAMPDAEFEDLQKQVPLIGRDLAARLSEIDIYQHYVDRMSFIYKIAKDVLEAKYEEAKGKPEAYRELQNEFEARYLRVLSAEATNNNELGQIAGVSQRTLQRRFKRGSWMKITAEPPSDKDIAYMYYLVQISLNSNNS